MSQKTPVKTITKDILARCMATENIRVEHRADAPSAYFDVENRVLGLPVWKDMDSALYDMLVGHEVSHALHTPAEGWQEFVGEGKESGVRHMFCNVVEDARIERLIKDRFPGLRRDFSEAYKSLHDRDLFELKGKNIAELPLIDRLNIHFKLGLFGYETVPFSASEQQYVTRMAETTTFEQVVDLAQELYEMYKDEQDEQEQEQEQESGQQSPGAGDGEGSGSGSTPSDSDESGEGGAGSGADDTDESDDESGSGGSGDESGEDSGTSMEDDTDDGESAESTTGESGESGDGEGDESELSYEDYDNNTECAGSTQRTFEKGIENLRDENARSWKYSTLPTPNLDAIVVTPKQIADLWTKTKSTDKWQQEHVVEARSESQKTLREFQNSIKGTVNQMVQQFQMKQAADAAKRTDIAKSGVLDTVNMINYRWSEDIFVKNEVHTDGKSHGIVMYLDWSGSMSGILEDTVKQLLVLVEFCRKVNIPFEVYAFSSNEYNPIDDRYSEEWDKWRKDNIGSYATRNTDNDCGFHDFQLYNFLSSSLNKRDWTEALENFWYLTRSQQYYGGCIPRCLSLGCTPLNEAIVCAMEQIPAFQRQHGVQIVNAVFLSDGDGHGMGIQGYYSTEGSAVLRDTKTGREYALPKTRHAETDALLTMLKDRTGANTIGIRLHDSKHIKNLRYGYWDGNDEEFTTAAKQYRNENFTTSTATGYDEQFIIKGDTEVVTDALDELNDDASYTRLKNAFIKGGNRKKSSRVIANRIIDIIAV